MNPDHQADYRIQTAYLKPFNMKQQMCAEPCRQRRSVGQFAKGDTWCLKCRRRATP